MSQLVLKGENGYRSLDQYFLKNNVKRIFLVATSSFRLFPISSYFYGLKARLGIETVCFSDFLPNPVYDSAVRAVRLFHSSGCDCIVAVGGGSAIDIAKCVKLYNGMDCSLNLMEQQPVENDIPFLAVPTTAGTGSEATRYIVIYYNGEKQSIAHDACIPSAVLLDSSVLNFLPDYQRKATMLDALCHGIESFWSVNSTGESQRYSEKAIQMILSNMESYLANEPEGNKNMLMAANLAGKAINITQTTAGHAMSYKLTSLYGIAHGHAVALCVRSLWRYMIENTDKCLDVRGKEYLDSMFLSLAKKMGCHESVEAAEKFCEIFLKLHLEIPAVKNSSDFDVLKESVNPVRLKNNPVMLDEEATDMLYHKILLKRT